MVLIGRALALAILLLPGAALGQTKPIQLIVPFGPGASADGIAPAAAPEFGARLGRTIVIENKAGVLKLPDEQAKVRLLTAQVSYQHDVAFADFRAAESAKWKQALQSVGLTN